MMVTSGTSSSLCLGICYSLLLILAISIGQTSAAVIELPSIPTLGSQQSVAVKGKVLCDGKPYHGAKIKLYDVDTTDPDDLMGETKSDEDGMFEVQGHETEITDIDPKLNIYHNCEDESRECLRKVEIEIPDKFISKGLEPNEVFDAGILNLSGQFPGETRDCLNRK